MLRPLKISRLSARCCSTFVSRMRYVNRLKQDDASCSAALQNAHMFLFHRLSPLLQRTQQGTFRTPTLSTTDVQSMLERLGSDRTLLNESVLIGCSEQNQVQFCLDVGELDQAAVEQVCGGNFISLRKAFFLLTEPEAPLVAKGQALLRWHQTSGFCSSTGEPTQRNQAGSQRVCSSSGIIYYPKMSPVVIVLVSDGKRCLLGRQSSFPQGLYSALAGFCDMGETVEETLRREVAEEVGLEVNGFLRSAGSGGLEVNGFLRSAGSGGLEVNGFLRSAGSGGLEVNGFSYSSSQHWPFPHSSFMMGFHASVSPAHSQLSVDHTELEDARWFSLEEITSALQVKTPPRRGDPQRDPPRRGDPQRDPPRRGDPQRDPPMRGDPLGDPPRRGDPQRDPPRRGDPQRDPPRRGDPQRDPPMRGDPLGDPPILWLPPKHAIGNRLITEWMHHQRRSEEVTSSSSSSSSSSSRDAQTE